MPECSLKSSEFDVRSLQIAKLFSLIGYDAIQEQKKIYYFLFVPVFMNTQVDNYLLNFRRTEGHHFVSFNILKHNCFVNLGDRVNWFAEIIK